MSTVSLAAKALTALMLLVAGGAKLADLEQFAASVRLFIPKRLSTTAVHGFAGTIAVAEFALGAGSLSFPRLQWLNVPVFAVCCIFFVVSLKGYLFNRDEACRCFGALSRRKFDLSAVVRGAIVASVASLPMHRVAIDLIDLSGLASLLLLLAGVSTSAAAYVAARSLRAGKRYGLVTK